MKLDTDVALRKLQKLRRDPTLFFYDYFRKRLLDDLPPEPLGATGHVDFDLSACQVSKGAVVIRSARVTEQVKKLKRSASSKRLTLSWWNQ